MESATLRLKAQRINIGGQGAEASAAYESWAKGSYEIATTIAYRNSGRIGVPVLPMGYVVSASRIADRRIMLVGYRLADLMTRMLKL
jgi:hypothetical protein